MESLPMSLWAAEDCPTNKIVDAGIRSLTTSELLSIIIGAGTDKYNQIEISKMLLAENGNSLSTIANMSVSQLVKFKGIGDSTAKRILAALNLGMRMLSEISQKEDLSTASRIYNHMYPVIGNLEEEEFWILMMNNNYKLINKKRISHGGITEVIVDIRIIMRECVMNNATILAVCHNHPSCSLRPSKADDNITKSIKDACNIMRIHFLDHVIITNGAYYSYHEQGRV